MSVILKVYIFLLEGFLWQFTLISKIILSRSLSNLKNMFLFIGRLENYYNMVTKTEDGRYKCKRCERASYTKKYNLYRHLRVECGVLPNHSCHCCDYRTKHKGSLKKHLLAVHKLIVNLWNFLPIKETSVDFFSSYISLKTNVHYFAQTS